jgi:hypothetical protein
VLRVLAMTNSEGNSGSSKDKSTPGKLLPLPEDECSLLEGISASPKLRRQEGRLRGSIKGRFIPGMIETRDMP